MLCRPSLFPRNLNKRKPPVVDLENLIHDAAWKGLRMPSVCGCRKNPCKKTGLYLKVDWNQMDRRDTVESFQLAPGDVTFRPVQLYRTQFRNFSGERQTFTFHAERQTQSSMEMTIQEGISVSGNFNLNFSLPTPDVSSGEASGCGDSENFKLTSVLGGQVLWNKSVTDKFTKTETLKWGVDSAVALNDGTRALASLSVLEAKLVGSIRIRTDVTITSDSALLPVDVITRNGDEVIATVDVAAKSICKRNSDFQIGEDKRSFSYYTTILCKAVYGVEQVATVQLLKPGEEEDLEIEGSFLRTSAAPSHALPPRGGVTIEEIDCNNEMAIPDAIPLIVKS